MTQSTTNTDQPAAKKNVGCGTQIIVITVLSLLFWGAYELIMHVAASN